MSYAIPALDKFKQKLNKNGNQYENEKLIERNNLTKFTIQNLNFSYQKKF